MSDDAQLLKHYVRDHSEEAFAAIVHKHLNLVWGVARRITRDDDLARDVAQTVFTDLSRKAETLSPDVFLPGWLHRAAHCAACNHVRGTVRRAERERIAMSTHPETTGIPMGGELTDDTALDVLQPFLDEALEALPESDRKALLLRFLEERPLSEVGKELGIGDDAAQKRVARAIDKLRDHFTRRGLPVTGGTVLAAITAAGAQSAPADLALSITSGVIAATATATSAITTTAATATATAAGSTSTSVPAFSLTSMATMKTHILLVTSLAATTATSLWQYRQAQSWRTQAEELSAQLEQSQNAPLELSSGPFASLPSVATNPDMLELLRLRGEVAQLRRDLAERSGNVSDTDYAALQEALRDAQVRNEELEVFRAEVEFKATTTRTVDSMKLLGLAARIYATDNNDVLPKSFDEIKNVVAQSYDGTWQGEIPLDHFEFFPHHERTISEREPQLILFREKVARQGPNGTWTRVYTLADGSVQIRSSATGDFSEFEQTYTARRDP